MTKFEKRPSGGSSGDSIWPINNKAKKTTTRKTAATKSTSTTTRTRTPTATITTKFINACLGHNDCDINSDCHPLRSGEYDCTCKFGYEGDGKNCRDINECTMRIHDCHPFERRGFTDH